MKYYFLFLLLFFVVQCDIMPSANPVYPSKTTVLKTESNEFEELMEKDQINKKQVIAEVLTYLLNDDDSNDPKTAAVIDNNSSCDIILRLVEIQGNRIYNLPIPKHSKNQFVIYKGNYTMKTNVCAAKYYSQKQISAPLILKLSGN
ncbi:hypothetical protein AP75_00630 [Kaistella haifensis DSM 19056]|uniref:DUF6759 domain-containing protein n=1 Tax=Kaistella haifensis DSM 19056 TaxID=1450526 RepID=A0A246BCT0_9FLAO|nr:DUF6759 domain-containing protein [Kaistella haifensis]OWK99484.1 hypothetical protein AP75_00630 [Kaistella haifensis DSM 19056]